MKKVELELAFRNKHIEELKEMKENDQEVIKVFSTSELNEPGFDMSWLIKLDDKTIGYTDLVVVKKDLKYYINLALKPGYRTKEIIKETLSDMKRQAIIGNAYLESCANKSFTEELVKGLNSIEQKDNKKKVYKI